jgi:hypothetical protein
VSASSPKLTSPALSISLIQTAAYAVSEILRLRAAPIMPASAIIV